MAAVDGMQAPVTQLALGEQRKATTAATSSGRPKRPIGISRRTKSAIPCGSARWRRSQPPPGNQIEPGATLLTRMLSFARSRAIAFARLISAAFATL